MNINPLERLKFTFESKGSFTGNVYQGVFEIKPVLNLMDLMKVDSEKRLLLNHPKENEAIDPMADGIANTIALLKVYIQKAPNWYNETDCLKECFDVNILSELYSKVTNETQKWHQGIQKEAEKARKDLASI